jgi:hypothetical protein
MADDNKQNLQYFSALSMRQLYDRMQAWQQANKKRFLSASIHQDGGEFCCIALTNPTEVVIAGVGTHGGALRVTVDNYMDFGG